MKNRLFSIRKLFVILAMVYFMLLAGFTPLGKPMDAEASTVASRTIKAYKQYLGKHRKQIKNYAIVYIGGDRPALVTNLYNIDFNTYSPVYSIRKVYVGCALRYYRGGKVVTLYKNILAPGGSHALRYVKNYGILVQGDTLGTMTPERYYISNGKLKIRSSTISKYRRARNLTAKKNNFKSSSSSFPFAWFKVGSRNVLPKMRDVDGMDKPARFFDGVIEVSIGDIVRKGTRVRWKLNPGWHAEVQTLDQSTNYSISNGGSVRHWSGPRSWRAISIYAYKGRRGTSSYREIRYALVIETSY